MDDTMTNGIFENTNLLIVDDIVDNIKIIGNYLSNQGINIIPAISGKQALSLAVEKKPDMILLDIQMPEMNGFDVCLELKKNPETRDIPVLFLTARTETEDIIKGFEIGATDYILKPFKLKEVLMRIKNHLDLKKSKDLINQQNEMLKELNNTKDKFFNIIAHDLKNPLGNFRDVTKLFSEQYDSFSREDILDYIDLMKKSADKIYLLLENLLEWSRSQQGTIQFNLTTFNLKSLSNNIIGLFKLLSETKKIELINEIPDELDITADTNMITTVLRNLLSNAIKFTPPLGKIIISVKKAVLNDKKSVTISVSDTGIGIPNENLSKLFKIGESVSTKGTWEEKGTGLGLILCKEFIDKHKGNIWVESSEGKGSTFFFTIPQIG
jgi:signal transduction histidine kinase